jgi:hypothetical protein
MKNYTIQVKNGSDLETEIQNQINDFADKYVEAVVSDKNDEIDLITKKIKSLENQLEEIITDEKYYFLIDDNENVFLDFHNYFLKQIGEFEFISKIEESEDFYFVEYSDFEYDSCYAILNKASEFVIKKCTNYEIKNKTIIIEAMGYMLDDFDVELDSDDFYFYVIDFEGDSIISVSNNIKFDEEKKLFEVERVSGKKGLYDTNGELVKK